MKGENDMKAMSIYKGMTRRFVMCIYVLGIAMSALATGQESDVIVINGKRWELLGKPIKADSVLRTNLLAILPKERSISTANWDGYKAYWSVKSDRLYLDSITVTFFIGRNDVEVEKRLSDEDMHHVFGKYYEGDVIIARWVTDYIIRAGKGKLLFYVHGGFSRFHKNEQTLKIEQGKVVERHSYHNKVLHKRGFSLGKVEWPEGFPRQFRLHVNDYPELAGVKSLVVIAKNMKLNKKGRLLDCDVTVRTSGQDEETSRIIEGLSQEMKEKMMKLRWRTLYLNGNYYTSDLNTFVAPYVLE